jgi:murein DD-endopeptidase MepM/ murein hydrolase activator NlpD
VRGGSFLLERPIGPDGRDTIVTASRFGEYQKASDDAQIGVYFLNSEGTPVLAVADGEVIVAGDDSQMPYGPVKGMYGNLVILEHNLAGLSEPLFTLYGHLSQVSVEEGDAVSAGDVIGLVGSTGSATGSILVFEVRLGENNPTQARNPELWLKPLEGDDGKAHGAIAGQIVDAAGDFIHVPNIVLEQLAGAGLPVVDQFYLQTYSATRLRGLDPWEESFAIGDLLAGDYQISFLLDGILHQQVVSVKPGRLTLVTITVE